MKQEDDRIRLLSVEIKDEDTLVYHFAAGDFLRRFVNEAPLWVRYAQPVRNIPASVAAIPFAAIFSPVVWSVGGVLEMPELESRYARSLTAIKAGYQRMLPAIKFDGEVRVEKKPELSCRNNGKAAMLFSGGIDSLSTLLRHQQEDPLLISIRGSDVRLHETLLWERVNLDQAQAAKTLGLRRTTVESNYFDILRQWSLDIKFMDVLPRNWYADISHGQILLGLCAPITWLEGTETLYIASSFPEAEQQPGGSNQLLDEATAWGCTHVIHDGVDESRQDKVEAFVAATRDQSVLLPVRVCSLGRGGRNCSVCEKCSRTIAGLALAGADSVRYGLSAMPDTPARIRHALEQNRWQLPFSFFWRDMQKRVSLQSDRILPGWQEFFQWLESTNLELLIHRRPRSHREELKRKLKRSLPFPVYAAVRRWKRQWIGPRFDY